MWSSEIFKLTLKVSSRRFYFPSHEILFLEKEEILSQNEQTFLNAVNLLCEVFEHLRLADGTVINVLAVPILEYCDLLLTSQSHDATQLLGKQLQVRVI